MGMEFQILNLKKLVRFHKKYNKTITLSAVRPPARFGAIKISETKSNILRKNLN